MYGIRARSDRTQIAGPGGPHAARRMVAGGLTGGLVIVGRVAQQLTVAPEFRSTTGLITDVRSEPGISRRRPRSVELLTGAA